MCKVIGLSRESNIHFGDNNDDQGIDDTAAFDAGVLTGKNFTFPDGKEKPMFIRPGKYQITADFIGGDLRSNTVEITVVP